MKNGNICNENEPDAMADGSRATTLEHRAMGCDDKEMGNGDREMPGDDQEMDFESDAMADGCKEMHSAHKK